MLTSGPCGRLLFDDVVVMDTETTGLAPFGVNPDDGLPTGDPHGPDRLCSVAGYRLRRTGFGWHIADHASWLVNPCRPISEFAAKVNGFAWSDPQAVSNGRIDLQGQPLFADIVGELEAFVMERPVCCHNIVFDMSVLDAEFARAGRPLLPVHVMCTKKAFSDIIGFGRPSHYIPGSNLNRLCDRLDIDRRARLAPDGGELHGAAIDALLAAECFIRLEKSGWMLAEDPESLPHRRSGLPATLQTDARPLRA